MYGITNELKIPPCLLMTTLLYRSSVGHARLSAKSTSPKGALTTLNSNRYYLQRAPSFAQPLSERQGAFQLSSNSLTLDCATWPS